MLNSSLSQQALECEDSNSAKKELFEQNCVTFFGEIVQLFNIPRSVGQIYGLLFASQEPLSFTDIVAKLAISKGSASQGLQLLRSLGAVHDKKSLDSRRQLFAPELSLRKLIHALLREKVDTVVQAGVPQVRALKVISNQIIEPATRAFYNDRIHQIESWRSQIKILLPLLRTLVGNG